jgi:hypothetical protein
MPETVRPLRTDHVFVLQLQESSGCSGSCRAGRVEHLASGEATKFTTTTELWDFVDEVLTEVADRRTGGTLSENSS